MAFIISTYCASNSGVRRCGKYVVRHWADGERLEECSKGSRWCELKRFPAGSYDLASNCLVQYLKNSGEKGEPIILYMCGNQTFLEAENSTTHGHVIVILDGEYIDLTLEFDEYTDYNFLCKKCGGRGEAIKLMAMAFIGLFS
ncbi:hypothetical protein [Pantoea sp. JK]|uniref:hypothetical protein n=1 Tax=Pantoea sp. JK TaxID=2871703 RepID=UPI002237FDFE|nr:hypothetical protein [Pantoea sp. JK]MCW6034470.1 hypothetical protein [Pantoea sp. JK]